MAKKLKIFIVAAIVIFPSLIISIPRFARCYDYYKLISETYSVTTEQSNFGNIGYLNTLSQKPAIIDFPKTNLAANFSIGYAKFYIDPNTINSIRFLQAHAALFIDCNDYHLGFLAPTNPSQMYSKAIAQSAKTPGKGPELFKLMIENPFEAQVKIASVCPKTYPQIFLMSDDAYDEYVILCMFKTMLNDNDNGIGIFKTDAINGIIRFGAANKPAQMLAEIFSKDSGITQEIVVTSSSSGKSRQALSELLSSYALLVNNVPEESAMGKSIMENLRSNPKFILDTENKMGK